MNKVADFSDTLADRWDELCYHDPEKLNDILQRTGLRKGLRILDIGCGTGVLESYLLPYSPLQIVGVDISPGMIEKAKTGDSRFAFGPYLSAGMALALVVGEPIANLYLQLCGLR